MSTADNNDSPAASPPHQAAIDIIHAVSREEYGQVPERLRHLLQDVAALYDGRWPGYEACAVPYHNFGHALAAAETLARMAAGWNRSPNHDRFPEELFLCGIVAALFHDAGYIKDRGDREGLGGKYTFTHVRRSMEMAGRYLTETGWPTRSRTLVPAMISLTDYHQEPDAEALFQEPLELTMARMIPTADLVAQMADNTYLPRLEDLFLEFQEGYEHEGPDTLQQHGTPVYHSAGELKDGVVTFYEEFVAPRLRRYGHLDRYLTVYFGEGRNPYHESIAANLSSQLLDLGGQWRRLGEILIDLGLVSGEQIDTALSQQTKNQPPTSEPLVTAVKSGLLPWMEHLTSRKCLGGILMDMEAITPAALAKGLMQQMLPDTLIAQLNRRELSTLVRLSMLLQNINKGPWILHEALELVNGLMACEASSILLARPGSDELIILLPTGLRRHALQGQVLSADKGLAGWVYRNNQPAMVVNVLTDSRFDQDVDLRFNFETRSLLAVPLRVNGVCVGVIEAINKKSDSFTEHDMHILITLANMVSAALMSIINQQPAS